MSSRSRVWSSAALWYRGTGVVYGARCDLSSPYVLQQPCVAEPIKEDAWEDSREPSSDIILVPPTSDSGCGGVTDTRPEASTLLVCYNGNSGGSVRIQTSAAAADDAA